MDLCGSGARGDVAWSIPRACEVTLGEAGEAMPEFKLLSPWWNELERGTKRKLKKIILVRHLCLKTGFVSALAY